MPVAAVSPPEAVAAEPVCLQCGAALEPGRRFCKQCGQPADAATAPTVFEQPLSAQTSVELPEIAADDPFPMAASHAPTLVMEAPYIERFSPESAPASPWEPVAETAPIWSASTATIHEHAPKAEPLARSKAKIVWAVGLAAAVLAAAGGGWAWYAHAHRSVSSDAGPVAPQQSSAQPWGSEQDSAAPGTTAQLAKPSAGVPAVATPQAQQTPPNHAPSVPVQPQSSSQSGHGNPAAPTPAFHVAPSRPAPQLAQGRMGIRHYEGPPVPHGGTVVFDNLPKARLRFAFDHTLWQLTIKPNPDGTKKVIMISLAQGSQTSCDLGWEIVE